MTKKLKVAVYCRVPARQAKDLLEEQENILLGFADDNDMEVVEVIKEIADGRDFKSHGIQELLNKIKRVKAKNLWDNIFSTFEERATTANITYKG